MNFTKQSEASSEQCHFTKDSTTMGSELDPADITEQFYEAAIQTSSQAFHKTCIETQSGQNIMKHTHKAFRIYKAEEDLSLFCLSLLQFQAQFPLRFYFESSNQKCQQSGENTQIKDVWLQTQFLICSTTTKNTYQKEIQFEGKIFRFFTEYLIPLLVKFKEDRMSWKYMLTQHYTDEGVIAQFNESIVKKVNSGFKSWCKQI